MKRPLTKRTRWTLLLLFCAGLVLLLEGSRSQQFLGFLYRHRFNPRFFTGNVMLHSDNRVLDLDLDQDTSASFFAYRPGLGRSTVNWHRGRLRMDGRSSFLQMARFENYFKYLEIDKELPSTSIRIPGDAFFDGIRRFDIFDSPRIEFFEQQLIYDLARRIGLHVPRTEYVNLRLNRGSILFPGCIMKQAFDEDFLEDRGLTSALVFMLQKRGNRRWEAVPLEKKGDFPAFDAHIREFLRLIESGDDSAAEKFFDLDYMARFETLRGLIGVSPGFILAENLRFIYDGRNGKFYPILDESNLLNLQVNHRDRELSRLTNRLSRNSVVRSRVRVHLSRLGTVFEDISAFQKRLSRRYLRAEGRFKERFIIRLITRYYRKRMQIVLKAQQEKMPFETAVEPSPSDHFFRGDRYLDEMLFSAAAFKAHNPELRIKLDDERIILEKGDYEVTETLVIPRGYVFEMEAGAEIRIVSGASIVSFSPIRVNGVSNRPVSIASRDPLRPFGALVVMMSPGEMSRVRHLELSGGRGAVGLGMDSPGSLVFFGGRVDIENLRISGGEASFGLCVFNSHLEFGDSEVMTGKRAHVLLNSCQGSVRRCSFRKSDQGDGGRNGLELHSSRMLLENNLFAGYAARAFFSDRSTCMLMGNTFRMNSVGVTVTNMSRTFLLGNRMELQHCAVRSFPHMRTHASSRLFFSNNNYEDTLVISDIDKNSAVYDLDEDEKMLNKLVRTTSASFEKPQLSDWDWVFATEYENRPILDSLWIAGSEARIDQANKVIFARLPLGSSQAHRINYRCRGKSCKMTLYPRGAFLEKTGDARNGVSVINGDVFDFQTGLFYGRLVLRQGGYQMEYDLFASRDKLSLCVIETRDESGELNKIRDEPKIPCIIQFISPSRRSYGNKFFRARIESRGKTGAKRAKWKYGFTLEEPLPLDGMPASKKWVLESSYIDRSLMRSKLALDLLEQFRMDKTRRRVAAGSRFVEVFLNDDYRGVYLLMEHIDKDFLGLDEFEKNEIHNAVLYQAENKNANFSETNDKPHYEKDYRHFPRNKQPMNKAEDPIWGWHSGFEQKYPEHELFGEHWLPMDDFSLFVARSSDIRFESRIFDVMDMENFVDWWIWIQLIDDQDGLKKNFYIAKNRGQDAKWFFIPWDKDGVLGRKHDMKRRSHTFWLKNNIFERCLRIPSFRSAFAERWNELREKGIISVENLYQSIDGNLDDLGDSPRRNFMRWPVVRDVYPDGANFTNEIEYMKDWIARRIEWLDEVIPERMANRSPAAVEESR